MIDDEKPGKSRSEKGSGDRRSFLINLLRCGAAVIPADLLHRVGLHAQEKAARVLATVRIADHPNLEKVGGFVLIKDSLAGELLIIRTSEDEYTSLSTVCPHKRCKVRVVNTTLIRCPCHKSAYKINGTYIRGPAKASLRKFVTRVEGGVLTVLEN
jgi:Rieske Fe-S protein